MSKFSEILTAKLKRKGTSQAHLARFMKVSPATVHYWMKGGSEPRTEHLERIAMYFGCSAGELLGELPQGIESAEEIDDGEIIDLLNRVVAARQQIKNPVMLTYLKKLLEALLELGEAEADTKKDDRQ